MEFERAEAGWQPGRVQQVERVDIQPALLGQLFGPPGPADGKYSSGNYRFRGEGGQCIDIFDWRLTREATGSAEERPAASLWSSQESWMLEVGATDPKVLPDFYRWLSAKIAAAVHSRLQEKLAAGWQLLSRGQLEEARKKLWEAEEWLPPDPRLEDPDLGAKLAALKAAIKNYASAGPLLDPRASITFQYGQAFAPDSRGGSDRLTIHPDGRLELEVQQGNKKRRWSARTDPDLYARFRDVLVAVDFPNIPMAPLVSGPSFWNVIVQTPSQRLAATFPTNPYRRIDPHRLLFNIGTSLCAKIRNDPNSGLSDLIGVTVSEVMPQPSD